jgi:2-hydroxychromene-2-carboxylate isomerase
MRGCMLLEAEGKLVAFARAAFEAYWGEDEDISQDAVLARVCARAGVNPAYLFAGLGEQSIKDKLRANTEELIRRGGFGSPTIFVDGTDMYFGNDRLVLVRDAVERAQAKRRAG